MKIRILPPIEASSRRPRLSADQVRQPQGLPFEVYLLATVWARTTYPTMRSLDVSRGEHTCRIEWKGVVGAYREWWSEDALSGYSGGERHNAYDRWHLWPKLLGAVERLQISVTSTIEVDYADRKLRLELEHWRPGHLATVTIYSIRSSELEEVEPSLEEHLRSVCSELSAEFM